MEIRILGDFDFAREIISGVARLFSYGNGFGYASGILLALYFLFLILKHAHDSERSPNPMKEFVFGIMLFLLVGGGSSSAKFDVELISISDPSRFEVINDVPALAAIPAWLTSNFLGILREKMENEFTPVTYTAERGVDPLGALIRLYERKVPTSSFEGPDEDYVRSMHEYMENCFLADQQLDRAAPSTTISDLKKVNMAKEDALIDALKVEYDGLFTNTYLGNNLRQPGEQYGERVNCVVALDRLKQPVSRSSNSSGSQEIESMINNNEVEQYSVQAAIRMVSGAYNSESSPYGLQANLLLAYLAEQGVQQAGFGSEAHRMVFEGYTKAVAQKVGEASIFKKFMVPTTTALETFSFYIAPILMMLAIMGGVGFSYITKYLGLVLYINLFSFVKVFVDVFTAISVERAFSERQGTPLSFESLPSAMEEISAFLATSATLTTSIPLLAMFLLYGSAMTLSGAVKSMGGGNANGNILAPDVGTSMNGGTAQVGSATVQYDANSGAPVTGFANQSNSALGDITFSQGLNAAGGSQINSSTTAAKEAGQQAMDSFAKLYQEGVKSSQSTNASSGHSSADSLGWSAAQGMVSAIKSATGWNDGQTLAFIANGGVRGAVGGSSEAQLDSSQNLLGMVAEKLTGASAKVKAGASAEAYAGFGGDYRESNAKTDSLAMEAAKQYTKSLTQSGKYDETKQALQNWALSKDSANSSTYQEAESAYKNFKQAEQLARVDSTNVNSTVAANKSGTLGLNNMAAAFDDPTNHHMQPKALENITRSLNSLLANDSTGAIRDSLGKAGISVNDEQGQSRVDTGSLASRFNELTQFKAGSGYALIDSVSRMNDILSDDDRGNYNKSVADNKINSAIWGSVADTLKDAGMGTALYQQAANYSDALGRIASSSDRLNEFESRRQGIETASGVGTINQDGVQAQRPNTNALQDNVTGAIKDVNNDVSFSGATKNSPNQNEVMTNEQSDQIMKRGEAIKGQGLAGDSIALNAISEAYSGLQDIAKNGFSLGSLPDIQLFKQSI